MVAKKNDDLNRWKSTGNQNNGFTASIKHKSRKYEAVVIIDVAVREDPSSQVCTGAGHLVSCLDDVVSRCPSVQDGHEDVYYRVVNLESNLIHAFKVREAEVTIDRSVPKYARTVCIVLFVLTSVSNTQNFDHTAEFSACLL